MRRVLFVDDEPKVLEGLENLLFPYMDDWEMEFAESGDEALEILESGAFNVLVTDVRMPGMDGTALLRRVKEGHPGTVRIVLSGHSELVAAMKALPIAHQYLCKPCDPDVLTKLFARTCGLYELISDEKIQAVIGDVKQLPARPAIYTELCALIDSDHCSLAGVARLVEKDVGISTKVLHVANTAFFSRGSPITSVSLAVPRLGARFVRDLVLGFETYQVLGKQTSLDVEALHREGFAVGSVAREMVPERDRESAFLAGFVHDIGRMVLGVVLPEQAAEVERLTKSSGEPCQIAEASILGITHAEIGAYLLGLWGMPYPVVEAVCHHHDPTRVDHDEFGLLTAVYVAHALYDAANNDAELELDMDYLARLGVANRVSEWADLMQSVLAEMDDGA